MTPSSAITDERKKRLTADFHRSSLNMVGYIYTHNFVYTQFWMNRLKPQKLVILFLIGRVALAIDISSDTSSIFVHCLPVCKEIFRDSYHF